jgi:SAM-dependent methyltransferase
MTATPARWGAGNVPSYDAIAEEYAEKFFDELDGKPFDREVLDRFAASVKGRGRVCDLGCGPGQIARYLAGRGVDAFGIDASVSMVATARRLNPTLDFRQGDFFALPLDDSSLAGVTAFYCLIHCARTELGRAAAEIYRVLMPGGRLLMTVHAGDGEVGRDEAYGKRVALVATLFSEDEVRAALTAARFRIDAVVTRDPYAGEYPSRRIYATAARDRDEEGPHRGVGTC